jgi:hypothetical protein
VIPRGGGSGSCGASLLFQQLSLVLEPTIPNSLVIPGGVFPCWCLHRVGECLVIVGVGGLQVTTVARERLAYVLGRVGVSGAAGPTLNLAVIPPETPRVSAGGRPPARSSPAAVPTNTPAAGRAEEAYVTIAEMLRAEGEARGEACGRIEALVQLLTLKFGPLQPVVLDIVLDIVHGSSTEQLETWTARVLTADTLDDVLH